MNSFAHLNDMRSKKPYPKNLAGHLRRNNHEISSSTIEFVEALLQINPKVRLSCEQALSHKFFIEKPYPCEKS